MAGLPDACIDRARQILRDLEDGAHKIDGAKKGLPPSSGQLELFGAPHPVLDDLREVDVNALTPLEALNTLAALKKRLERG
jgi:DNA mismatch repair protein MutS